MIEPMTIPERLPNGRKKTRTATLSDADVATVRHFQRLYKLESFSQALRRIIRDHAEICKVEEAA